MAVLDEILSFNQAHTPAPAGASGSPGARRRVCLVTCVDPRLDRFFSSCLGLERGDAVTIRLPGPALPSQPAELMRAIASAVFIYDAAEILVMAHTDCGLTRADGGSLASALARHGVDRAAIEGDLRSYFALQASPRQLAIDTANAIRQQPFLPAGVPVHAAVLDLAAGALEVLERGEDLARSRPQASSAGPAPLGSSLSGLGTGISPALAGSPGPVQMETSAPLDLGLGGPLPLPQEASGPLAATPSSLPPGPDNVSSLRIEVTKVPDSDIKLSPSTKLEPAPAPSQPLEFVDLSSAPARAPAPRGNRPSGGPATSPGRTRAAPTRVAYSPQMAANLARLREFLRSELDGAVRSELARALAGAFDGGSNQGDMIRIVFRPVLESGPKRYKVIDEMLAIKEAASAMDRDSCAAALRQLLD